MNPSQALQVQEVSLAMKDHPDQKVYLVKTVRKGLQAKVAHLAKQENEALKGKREKKEHLVNQGYQASKGHGARMAMQGPWAKMDLRVFRVTQGKLDCTDQLV